MSERDITNRDLCRRIDQLEKMMLEANDGSEKLADRLNNFFDNFDGFAKTITTFGKFVFFFGILWAIFGDKITGIIGG